MTRSELEHLIRAAGAIAEDSEIIIVGSQSILGQFPDAPPALVMSAEADVYPMHHPERADLIDGSIGEGSRFHETFGYYAQGVGEETATLPTGWQSRLVKILNATRRARLDSAWKYTTSLSRSTWRGAKKIANSRANWRAMDLPKRKCFWSVLPRRRCTLRCVRSLRSASKPIRARIRPHHRRALTG
jgi:hypothetical protein